MLATIEQLRKYLRTAGATGGGASIDAELLELVLNGASTRVAEARPERTLDLRPALVNAGTDEAPAWEEGEPVEVRIPIVPPCRIVQVPDLREVVSMSVARSSAAGPVAGEPILDYTLRRRPFELCALWVRFRSPLLDGDELVITGRFGPAGAKVGTPVAELDVRGDVRDAVLVWASRAYHNRTARFADTVQDPAGGVASYFRNLPPDVKLVVDSLEVPGL